MPIEIKNNNGKLTIEIDMVEHIEKSGQFSAFKIKDASKLSTTLDTELVKDADFKDYLNGLADTIAQNVIDYDINEEIFAESVVNDADNNFMPDVTIDKDANEKK